MRKVEELAQHLRPSQVYRRAQLAQWSNAVDRHIKKLFDGGTLIKLKGGLYHYPRNTTFGAAQQKMKRLLGFSLKMIAF